MSFKAEGEIEGIFETNLLGDMADGLLGELEELAGAMQALMFEVALWGLAGLGAKQMGKAREGKTALARDFRDGEGRGKVSADVIEGAANARIDPGDGVFRIGQGAAQQDFLERIHGERLALGRWAGVDLQHLLIATLNSGLLLVAFELEVKNPRRDLGPIEGFAPIGAGDKVRPERFPMGVARCCAIIVVSMGF